jgi:hypothetical protein
MAKVIITDDQAAIGATYEWWYVLLTGLTIGVLYVGLSALISHFVIDPLYCKATLNSGVCSNSESIGGNIATILSAVVALALFVRLRVFRPIVIVVAAAMLLWGLSSWTAGLGAIEIVVSSAILYGLCYILISWICRYKNTLPVLIAVALIVAGSRFIGLS